VLVIHGTEPHPITCNHAFILLTGFARRDIDSLLLSDVFGGPSAALFAECWENPECEFQDIPLKNQAGETIAVDIIAYPIAPPRSAILLKITPSSNRIRKMEKFTADRERLDTLAQISTMMIEDAIGSLPIALELARKPLVATYTAMYRVSPTSPDYVIEGTLPPDFPEIIPAASLGHPTLFDDWKRGQRPAHALHKSARAANLQALRTVLIGSDNAWVGLLVVGWSDGESVPDDVEPLSNVIANLLHTAILLRLLRDSLTETERKLDELRKEIRNQYAALSETLISVNENLIVTRANPSITRLLGYKPEEVVGQTVQDVLVGPEDVTTTLLDALGHRREAERTRLILHHRNGTQLPVHLRAVPLGDIDKTSLLIELKDQSEEQAIEDQTEILAQRALLGEVTAIFAHEVRNPINNITTGVQLVASRLGSEHPQHAALEQVRQECDRLNQLMTDVLFFARPLELKMQAIDLSELVDRILARWGPRIAQSGIRCHTTFDRNTPLTSADPRTLERVVVNLISNAIEAMDGEGTLSINISAPSKTRKDMVELKVADTGPGIPPDKIDRIFDPFFTTKKDGTGLGLAISRRILTAHKGTIRVESFPDAGTVFTIQLPAAVEGNLERR
jgi:two-component system sensor histidine kinase AtoS